MSLIGRFMTGEYEVRRRKVGGYVKGRYAPGDFETIQIAGSLQPTTARELKLAEEGTRLRQYFKFYSDEKVLLTSESSLGESDIIFVNGDEFKAMSREDWQNTDLDYFMTIIWREPQQSTDNPGNDL